MASMITDYNDKSFAKSIKSWVLISWTFQTLGILVGSIWAYYELGWGGFWFWDPVENASLLPWFAMTLYFIGFRKKEFVIFLVNNTLLTNFYFECYWYFFSQVRNT